MNHVIDLMSVRRVIRHHALILDLRSFIPSGITEKGFGLLYVYSVFALKTKLVFEKKCINRKRNDFGNQPEIKNYFANILK